jgi:hypothetical protein
MLHYTFLNFDDILAVIPIDPLAVFPLIFGTIKRALFGAISPHPDINTQTPQTPLDLV